MRSPRSTDSFVQRLLLVVLSPVVFLVLAEITVRILPIDTDLARNENFDVAVPAWLLADPLWVGDWQVRIARRSVKAADVEWFRHFEEARYIQYKLKPRVDVRAVNPFNEIDVAKQLTFRLTSNRDGFRAHEFTPKPPGVTRIVTLGDSSTFGWGVGPDYTFQELLAGRLRHRGVEVFNLGMPGHTSRHGRGVLEHYALDLEPDLMIISFGANEGREGPQTVDDLLAADETWLGAVNEGLLRLESAKLLRKAILSAYDPFQAAPLDRGAFVTRVGDQAFQDNLRWMIATGRERGIESLLLAMCTEDERYLERMRELADRMRIPLIDARALFVDALDDLRAGRLYPDEVRFHRDRYGEEAMANNWRLFVTTDACHPNRAGNSLIADALTEAIASIHGRDWTTSLSSAP